MLFVDNSEDAELKVVDFGFARCKGTQPMQTPCFTLSYAAPEILKHATQEVIDGYDEACDVWSLGVILVSTVLLIVGYSIGLFDMINHQILFCSIFSFLSNESERVRR